MKIKRQGLNVSINELRKLANELERQIKQFYLDIDKKDTIDLNVRWLIDIINKEPNCSDTWEIEKWHKMIV